MDTKIIDGTEKTVYDKLIANADVELIEWFEDACAEFRNCPDIMSLYKQMIAHYPFTSDEYLKFRLDLFEPLYLKPRYGHEYVFAIEKSSPYPNNYDIDLLNNLGHFNQTYKTMALHYNGAARIKIVPRYEAEYNPWMIHFVVGILPRTKNGNYVLLKRKYGENENKLTMVEGHMSYNQRSVPAYYRIAMYQPTDLSLAAISELMRVEASRELLEEIGATMTSDWYSIMERKYYYQPPMFITPESISYFHAGFMTSVDINLTDDQVESQEPDRNEVVIVNPRELRDIKIGETDIWLYNFIKARMEDTLF